MPAGKKTLPRAYTGPPKYTRNTHATVVRAAVGACSQYACNLHPTSASACGGVTTWTVFPFACATKQERESACLFLLREMRMRVCARSDDLFDKTLPLDLELNWYWLGIIQYPQPPMAWREVMRIANRPGCSLAYPWLCEWGRNHYSMS